MTRDLTSGVLTEITAAEVRVGLLVELNTDGGPVRAWSGIGDLVSQGNTFTGVGHLGGIGPIQEAGQEVRANALTLQLSGIPSALISTALTTQYQGRDAKAWLAFFTQASPFVTAGLVADPVLLFRGRMDTMQIEDGPETATITVACESRLADLRRPRIRRYTDEDQNQLFAGDRGLEFLAGLQEREIHWGTGDGPGGAVPPPGTGGGVPPVHDDPRENL